MNWLTRIYRATFGRRRALYNDLAEEMRQHLDERTEELMREGLSRADAESAARRAFGNPTLLEQRSREIWQWQAIELFLADVKRTIRRLRRAPAFTTTVLLTLAVGIGANTAVFSVINSVLLKPLPYPNSNRLVSLWLSAPGAGGLSNFANGLQLSPSMYFTFSRHNRSFDSMGIWHSGLANVTGVARPEQVHTILVSDGVLQTLEVPPALGRWFSQSDQEPHGAQTAMLSYGYWQRRFGGERNVIGRIIQVDSQPREIVGVMPRNFRMVNKEFDLLLPMALDPIHETLAPFYGNSVARLKPGVSIAQADSDIARLIPVWMDSWTNGPGSNPHYYETWRITPNLHSLKQQVIGDVSGVLWIVMATVGLVMLIACTNIANLLLVRSESRQHELAIRAALGAGRARIARELLLESLVLSLAGGAVAIGIASLGLRLLTAAGPRNLPRLVEISLDAHSLWFTLLLAVLSGLLFGSIPAWKYARAHASLPLDNTGRTASIGRARQHSRRLLVIAQVAIALVLLVCSCLMIRTFVAMRNVQPGFANPARVQTMRISIPESLIADPQLVTRTEQNISDRLAAIPGVSSAGFAVAVPMDGVDPNWDQIIVEGKGYQGGEPPMRFFNYVSPGYFHAMGTRLVAGRDFTWADIYGLLPKVIVSENFARESWGTAAAAIGKRVRQYSGSPWQEVIGVAQDVRQHGVGEVAPPTIYWPTMLTSPYTRQPSIQVNRSVAFVIDSSRAGTESFLNQMQHAVWSVNSNLPIASIFTMQQIYDQSMARTSFTLVMLAIAGVMALVLSIIGIYGVISYTVSQRTREMGIRLALGALPRELKWMFVKSALEMAGIGIVLGLVIAIPLTTLIRSLLFGVSSSDPATYLVVSLALFLAALLASYIPAIRAASIDPIQALRAE